MQLWIPGMALVLCLASLSTRVAAQAARTAAVEGLSVAAARRAAAAPVLDGRDDEALWRDAAVMDAFQIFDPVEGGEPHLRTTARFAYDARALYAFVRAFDPHPDSISRLLARRDAQPASDEVRLLIDSYHDRRTAFAFSVTSAGVKRDYQIYNDVTEDPSWDAVWSVAVRIDSLGWTAEFAIPLSQLRFAPAEADTFGILVERTVPRLNERYSWPLFRRTRYGIVSQLGELTGLTGLNAPRRMELAPYAVTRAQNPGGPGGAEMSGSVSGGADLHYGVSSNLTLNATVNPDFGQVEADPAVLNLSAFEPQFEEKRPFFLEGTSAFNFDFSNGSLFYSRRIGREPQLSPLYGGGPLNSTILGAARLTGRTAGGFTDRRAAGHNTA